MSVIYVKGHAELFLQAPSERACWLKRRRGRVSEMASCFVRWEEGRARERSVEAVSVGLRSQPWLPVQSA